MKDKLKLKRVKGGYYTACNGSFIIYKDVNNMWKVRTKQSFMAILQAETLGLIKHYYNQHGTFW